MPPPLTIAQLVISFIGGGLVSAIGNWLHANRSARREREMSLLQDQLRMLYGPLSFFTSQNEQLFKLSCRVQAGFDEFFTGRWSNEESVQHSLVQSGEATTALSNAYTECVVENNARVMALLENNWHLADLPDLDVFSRFQVDYTRYLHEVKQQGRKNVPLNIVMKLGPIAFMHPDMIAHVRATFLQKQDRLKRLRSTAIRSYFATIRSKFRRGRNERN